MFLLLCHVSPLSVSMIRLVNCAGLLSRSEVYEMADFDRVVKRDLESSKTLLTTKYAPH